MAPRLHDSVGFAQKVAFLVVYGQFDHKLGPRAYKLSRLNQVDRWEVFSKFSKNQCYIAGREGRRRRALAFRRGICNAEQNYFLALSLSKRYRYAQNSRLL